MPEGATSQDLENIPRFRKYAAENVHKWYKFINGPRGREAKNGDVRLVVGCDKATSWGMAVLSNVNQHCQLKFKPLNGQGPASPGCGYTWEYSGTLEVPRVVPDQEATYELRRGDPDDSTTQNKYLNQCLFVRTLNVRLNDDEWDKLNDEIGVGCTPGSSTRHGSGTLSPSPRNQDPSSDITQSASSTSNNSGMQRTAGDSLTLEFTSLNISANHLIFSALPTATVNQEFEVISSASAQLLFSHATLPMSSTRFF